MEVSIRQQGGEGEVCIVDIKGRLDATVAEELAQQIEQITDADQDKVLLNFAGVSFLSSSTFRVLLAALKKVKARAGALRLAEMNPYVEQTFQMTGFDEVFEIFSEESKALEDW